MTTQFNWLSYLDVAEHLASRLGEGFHRAATSRAYGVLIHTRDILQRLTGTPFSMGRDVHQEVINTLLGDPRPEVVDLGEIEEAAH